MAPIWKKGNQGTATNLRWKKVILLIMRVKADGSSLHKRVEEVELTNPGLVCNRQSQEEERGVSRITPKVV